MGSEAPPLRILFFPFMAPGHMLPMVDMAKLIAGRGVKATILTTPANAPIVEAAIESATKSYTHPIRMVLIPFPSAAAGLPEGCENLSSVPFDEQSAFARAVVMLEAPFRRALTNDVRPDAVVTDMLFPWTRGVAEELAIPRLVFHGTGFMPLCVSESLGWSKPPPDSESFVVPNLPHRIELLRSQVPDLTKTDPVLRGIFDQIANDDWRSCGVVVNSFYELEPDYANDYRKVVGRKAWHVGPVSLANRRVEEWCTRGSANKAGTDHTTCIRWLDEKEPGSVIYVCFGSLAKFDSAQLRELALGLERCGHNFVWVVQADGGEDEWMPPGFERRIAGRGIVLRGWVPQILILSHQAVGGFMTHCGWNSTLEGITAGVPMVTWPLFGEQFSNEKLIEEVVRTGVSIGSRHYTWKVGEMQLVDAAEIERVVRRIMDGREEAEGMRRRAKELKLMAKRAVEEGGSSYVDLGNLIQELTELAEMRATSEE